MNNILKSMRLDHDIMKSRYPMFAIAYVLGGFLAVITKVPVYGALIVMVISAPLTGQYFAVYEKDRLENLYGLLPLKKSNVVIGRYLYALCILIANTVIAGILAYVVSALTNKATNTIESLSYLAAGFAYVCLMVGVIFPLYFRFSYSKVATAANLPFYLLFVIGFALTRKTNVLREAGPAIRRLASNFSLAAICLCLGLGLLALSCLLSCALQKRSRP